MKPYKDLTGKRFGRWTVLRVGDFNYSLHKRMWLCKCECGTVKEVAGALLVRGESKSCGCLRRERFSEWSKLPRGIRKHGFERHNSEDNRLYQTWCNMKLRCYGKNANEYDRYGGRGISVCDEWLHDYDAFKDWALSSGYQDNLTIDRIDVNGNYEPSNCRWVDRIAQANNTSRNRRITFRGETKTLTEWSRELGISVETLRYRLSHPKWDLERAFTEPIRENYRKRGAG